MAIRSLSSSRRGVTLVELIVAMAIFATLVGSIGAIFVGSIRTVRSGEQAMDAYDEARAALSVIERDLTRAFTSRDAGHYHTFYGTPIGMTFVGALKPFVAGDDSAANLARVTYVIHRPSGESFETTEGAVVTTYPLIRYVEYGADDLDAFDIDWDAVPLLEDAGASGTLRDLLNFAPGYFVETDPTASGWRPLTAEEDRLVSAKKRELWIRMLGGGDALVPSMWAYWDQRAQDAGFADDGKAPQDYLVADAIVADAPPMLPMDPAAAYPGTPFFQYGRYTGTGASVNEGFVWSHYWNSDHNAPFYDADDPQSGRLRSEPGSPLTPRVPSLVAAHFHLAMPSPYPGAPDTHRRYSQVVDVPAGYTRTELAGALPEPDWPGETLP